MRLLEKERGKEEKKEIPLGISNAVKNGEGRRGGGFDKWTLEELRGKFLRPGKKVMLFATSLFAFRSHQIVLFLFRFQTPRTDEGKEPPLGCMGKRRGTRSMNRTDGCETPFFLLPPIPPSPIAMPFSYFSIPPAPSPPSQAAGEGRMKRGKKKSEETSSSSEAESKSLQDTSTATTTTIYTRRGGRESIVTSYFFPLSPARKGKAKANGE